MHEQRRPARSSSQQLAFAVEDMSEQQQKFSELIELFEKVKR